MFGFPSLSRFGRRWRLQLPAACLREKKTMGAYYAIVSQHEGGFALFFPGLPTCNVYALTMPDAVAAAGRVLGDHLAELQVLGRRAPEPSSLEKIRTDPDNAEGLAILINAATASPRTAL